MTIKKPKRFYLKTTISYIQNGKKIDWECIDISHYWVKVIKNYDDYIIYWKDFYGVWKRYDYDYYGNLIYFEDSTGYWVIREYDQHGNEIYYENSNGYWIKKKGI